MHLTLNYVSSAQFEQNWTEAMAKSPPHGSSGSGPAVEMVVRGEHGKKVKLFFHPSLSPWKSLRRFPPFRRHDDHEDEHSQSSAC